MKNTSYLVGAASALVAASQMYAASISGDISFAGSAALNGNVPVATAFTGFTGVTVGLGTQSGDYDVIPSNDGHTVAFHAFTFESGGLPATVGSPYTLWDFVGLDGRSYSFDVTSLTGSTKSTSAGITALTITGTGIAKISGLTDTAGAFTLQLSSKKSTVAFTSYATAVPEPTSWALVSGLGLAGFAFYRRARK
jgi:hypothetical protein